MKQFEITYFHGPFSEYITRPSIIHDIAANGITLIPLNDTTARNRTVLPLLRQEGLRAMVGDPRINSLYQNNDIAHTDETVRAIVSDYQNFDNIAGWDLVDEPRADKFPILSAITAAFHKYAPGLDVMINLFPDYAAPEQLGCATYQAYLDSFVQQVDPDILSYDYYHFCGRQERRKTEIGNVDERERLIRIAAEETTDRDGFFNNLEIIRRKALSCRRDAMLIVLLTEHGNYRNLTRAELRWEVNMCLAYGMRRISYFTYWEPSHSDFWAWTNAMTDTEGNLMPHYFDAQAINRQIMSVGTYLFARQSTAVFHIGRPERGTVSFTSYGSLRGIDGKDGVIGCFDDGSFYLVNRCYRDKNRFILHSEAPIFRYDNGKWILCDPEITLEAGDGILLKT